MVHYQHIIDWQRTLSMWYRCQTFEYLIFCQDILYFSISTVVFLLAVFNSCRERLVSADVIPLVAAALQLPGYNEAIGAALKVFLYFFLLFSRYFRF